jgi:hypothetical protein
MKVHIHILCWSIPALVFIQSPISAHGGLFLPGVTWSERKANLIHPKPRSIMFGNVPPLPILLYDIVFLHVLRNYMLFWLP